MGHNMLKLHHLNNSRSTRIIWLLEELGLDYELVKYEREDTRLAPDALKRIHPLGKAPILQDGKLTIAESGAIIEYILHQYDIKNAFSPTTVGSQEWLDYLFWLHFAEGSAMPPLLLNLIFNAIPERSPRLIKPIAKGISKQVMKSFVQPNIDRHNALIEETLAKQPWFAGEKLTGADVQMSFIIEAIKARGGLDNLPNMKKWLNTVRARPAYKAALEKGGELELG